MKQDRKGLIKNIPINLLIGLLIFTGFIVFTEEVEKFIVSILCILVMIGVPILLGYLAEYSRKSDKITRDKHIVEFNKKFMRFSQLTEDSKKRIENFDEIMKVLFEIQEFLEELLKLKKSYNWSYATTNQFHKTFIITFTYLLSVLKDLKNDLVKNIHTVSTSILDSQKTLQEYVASTNKSISEISQLQIIRLDRQIEQFKELEKILVKV